MEDEGNLSTRVVTGTGEFEHRGLYVMVTVELAAGSIKSVGFSTSDARTAECLACGTLSKMLSGKTVTEALEVSVEELLESCPNAGEALAHEVLLEAFHRALEACLDQQ